MRCRHEAILYSEMSICHLCPLEAVRTVRYADVPNVSWNPGTKRQYRYRHDEKKWSPLLILAIIHGQEGEGDVQETLPVKEGAPL